MFEIYLITNYANGKYYVGQTSTGASQRWKRHIITSKELKYPLQRAIQKYGVASFSMEILAVALTQADANWYERYFISQYNSFAPNNNGYNATLGGSGGDTLSGMSPEQKATYVSNMSALLSGENNPMFGKPVWTGKKHTAETRAKMSVSSMGKPGTMKGRRHSAETKAKMSESLRKRHAIRRSQNEQGH